MDSAIRENSCPEHGSDSIGRRKFAYGCLLILPVVFGLGTDRAMADQATVAAAPAGLSTTTTWEFDSPGQYAVRRLLSPLASRLLTTRIDLPRRPESSRNAGPVRQVKLLNGDRVLAEVVDWDGDVVNLRLRSGEVRSIDRTAIDSINSISGERDRLHESFEDPDAAAARADFRPAIAADRLDSHDSASGRFSLRLGQGLPEIDYSFAESLAAGRMQLWFRIADLTAAGQLQIGLQFAGQPSQNWTVVADARIARLQNVPENRGGRLQPVPLPPGWHCLCVTFDADQALCAVDGSLLGVMPSPGPLRSIRLASTIDARVDDLLVSQRHSPLPPPAVASTDDCVSQWDDQQFGRVTRVSSDEIVLSSPAGVRLIRWTDTASVVLAQGDHPEVVRPQRSGLQAMIEFQPILGRSGQESDRICATILSADSRLVIVQHAWLGEFAIGWNQIARITPSFWGCVIPVDARLQHLGNSIRPDFRRPLPDGTAWNSKFVLSVQDLDRKPSVWLAVDVAELEPSGPGTPPASPFLKDLRSGRLLTHATINEHSAGDLNRWIRFRSTPAVPATLRVRLPSAAIRSGTNTLCIHQSSLGSNYDNCELSNLRIELIEAP